MFNNQSLNKAPLHYLRCEKAASTSILAPAHSKSRKYPPNKQEHKIQEVFPHTSTKQSKQHARGGQASNEIAFDIIAMMAMEAVPDFGTPTTLT